MQPDARGKNRAIAYASRTWKQAESDFSMTHQETMAVVWALKHFRDMYLQAMHQSPSFRTSLVDSGDDT